VLELGVGTGELVERRHEDRIGFFAVKEEELAAELERGLGSADRILEQRERLAQMLDRRLAVDRRFCGAELTQQLRTVSRRRRLDERAAEIGNRALGGTTRPRAACSVAQRGNDVRIRCGWGSEQVSGDALRFCTDLGEQARRSGVAALARERRQRLVDRRAVPYDGGSFKEEPPMPRVAPITGKSDLPAEHHAVVDAVVKVFGGVRGPFSMLLHSPKLAERLLGLVTFFREESVVDARLRSVAILTAVREREAAYVWAAQVAAARRNGLDEAAIDLLRAKGDAGRLPAEEREIVTYVRQLMRTNRADQSAFDALAKRHDAQWLVELTATANYFAFLSGVVNAFEVAAPPDGDKLPV